MAKSLNKVMLIGNVGSEPEVRTTANGKHMAKFSLATNRSFTGKNGQQQEKTEWHRVTVWERTAEIVEKYVHKGDRIYVEGSIEYSQTEDENGKPRYWTDIIAREVLMLGGAGGEEPRRQAASARSRTSAPSSPFEDDDDDLPF